MVISNPTIDIWTCAGNENPFSLDDSLSLLSPEERLRAGRLVSEVKKRQFVASRLFLKTVLAHYLSVDSSDIHFSYDEHGKPVLLKEDHEHAIHFSLSYSSNLCVLAISRQRPVGVDVEDRDRKIAVDELAERFFSEEEQLRLGHEKTDTQKKNLFLTYWTFKEALCKAVGSKAPGVFSQLTIHLADDVGLSKYFSHWRIYPLQISSRHVGAVSLGSTERPWIQYFKFHWNHRRTYTHESHMVSFEENEERKEIWN